MELAAPSPPRSPWQWLYGAAHALRRRWHRGRAARLPRPVVSVGNLSWGGSGKTPMVAAIAAHLRDGGRRVAILSRGYGRRGGPGVRLVSDGEGPLLGPMLAGDEPVLLAGDLPGVAVVVGADRARAGRHALERLGKAPDVFLLDDGFSHLALERDLDLLLFPAADPFAGGRLLPGGRLREPLASSARADAAILTGYGELDRTAAGAALARALRPYGFRGAGFAAGMAPEQPRFVTTAPGPGQAGSGKPVPPGSRALLVSGIARPRSFRDTVERLGFPVADHLVFPDHHEYPDASLAKIVRGFHESGATVVMATGKDRVKLQGRLELPLAEVPIRAAPAPELFVWLDERLAEIAAGGSSR